jgi:hypothetical protein
VGRNVYLTDMDSEFVYELRREFQVWMFVSNTAHCIYEWARIEGLGKKDYASIILLWEKLLGLRVAW